MNFFTKFVAGFEFHSYTPYARIFISCIALPVSMPLYVCKHFKFLQKSVFL